MQGLMEFHGHTVVQPLGKLSKPLGDYFSDPRLWATNDPPYTGPGTSVSMWAIKDTIERWFSLDEQGCKECIRRRGKERCFVTGESTRTVHEFATRGANRSAALVPYNMGLVEPMKIHTLLQDKIMKMVRFDPLDTRRLNASKSEGCLIIYSPNGRLMKEDELWMYQRPKREEAELSLMDLKAYTKDMRELNWIIAHILKRLKDSGGYAEEGWDDIYMCAAQHGYTSSEVKAMIRAAKLVEQFDLGMYTRLVSVEVVDRIRKVPEKDLSEILSLFAEQPPAEAWEQFNTKYPPKGGKRKFRIMKRQPYREVYVKSIDEVEYGPNDMVEMGGQIIVGIKEEIE